MTNTAETPDQHLSPDTAQETGRTTDTRLRRWLRALMTLVFIAAGVMVATVLLKTAPKAVPQPAERQPHVVETKTALTSTSQITLNAMGVVKPAQEVRLQAQVSGEVIALSRRMQPGALLQKDEPLVRLNPEDYTLALQQREASVAQAQADLELEQGNQLIARKEYALLNRTLPQLEEALILRQPQLSQRKAALASARSERDKARLDLKRTQLNAPFNAQVIEKSVDLGSLVTTNAEVATLVGTDHYWLEVTLPASQLKWLRVPTTPDQTGSRVTIHQPKVWGANTYRTGQVIRLLPDVETSGRLARVLVTIPDPLSLTEANRDTPPLLLNSFVEARIEGASLDDVIEIPRSLLRDGQTVWLMDEQDRLEIRPVEVAFRGRDRLIISQGLSAGDRLITSQLAAPVVGMQLITPQKSTDNGVPE